MLRFNLCSLATLKRHWLPTKSWEPVVSQCFWQLILVNEKAWLPAPCAWEGAGVSSTIKADALGLPSGEISFTGLGPASLTVKGLVFGQLWYTVLVTGHTFNCLAGLWPHDCVRGRAGTERLRLESVSGSS